MSLSKASSGISAARFAMNPTPLGAAGLVGGAMLGGKGGGGTRGEKFDPVYKDGKYGVVGSMSGYKELDTSKYQFNGNNGNYDLIPLLQEQAAANQKYNPYNPRQHPQMSNMDVYNKMQQQMANDPAALAQLQATYAPKKSRATAENSYRKEMNVDFNLDGVTAAQKTRNAYAPTKGGMNAVLNAIKPMGNQVFTPAQVAQAVAPIIAQAAPNAGLLAQIAAAGGGASQPVPNEALPDQIARARRIQ